MSTLTKESKRSSFTNNFQNSLNDVKGTQNGIKNLISLKKLSNVGPSNIFDNGRSLTEPQEIANALINILLTLLLTFNLLLNTQTLQKLLVQIVFQLKFSSY